MKLTKQKLKQLVKEGLAKGLGNLQLNEFPATAGDATTPGGIDGTGGEEKISGNVKQVLEGIVSEWNPTTPEGKKYEADIMAVIKNLGSEVTAE